MCIETAKHTLSAHRRFSQQKCCEMHESPVRRAAPQHPEVDANDSNGPFVSFDTKGGLWTFSASASHPSRKVGSRHSSHPKLGLALRCRKSAKSPLYRYFTMQLMSAIGESDQNGPKPCEVKLCGVAFPSTCNSLHVVKLKTTPSMAISCIGRPLKGWAFLDRFGIGIECRFLLRLSHIRSPNGCFPTPCEKLRGER
jgi:hypothetical protein